jgi:FkbH-like protein
MSTPRYRLSDRVEKFQIDESRFAIAHPFYMTRSVLNSDAMPVITSLAETGLTVEELQLRIGGNLNEAKEFLAFLTQNGYVVEEGVDEDVCLRNILSDRFKSPIPNGILSRQIREHDRKGRVYSVPAAFGLSLSSFRRAQLVGDRPAQSLSICLAGGCFLQFAADALEMIAPSYGLSVDVSATWLDIDAISSTPSDLLVVQPLTPPVLAPLWDGGAFVDDASRSERLEAIKEYLSTTVRAIVHRRRSGLLLVQGIARPALPPDGRSEFRREFGYDRIVYEINEHLRQLLRENEDALFVDTETLFGNVGKIRLLDEAVVPYSHQGLIDATGDYMPLGRSRVELFGVQSEHHAARLLATEFLDDYILWSGIDRVKCVIVDLDEVLWPGVLGENEYNTEDGCMRQSLRYGVYGGIHQALRILRDRGILLATCSRNNFDEVREFWQELEEMAPSDDSCRHLLRFDDFVIHRINWNRKPQNILEIASAIGIGLDSIVLIDDSETERVEVAQVLPKVRVIGGDVNSIRSVLLGDPRFQMNVRTSESSARSVTVAAQILRDKTAANGQEFLQTLCINLTIVRCASGSNVSRIVELSQRTNQFNTSLIRYTADEVRDILDSPHNYVYTLEVKDRFANYGIVGACIVRNNAIESFMLSCRVISLDVAVPFLSESIRNIRPAGSVTAKIVESSRNQPCRSLFIKAGFTSLTGGGFVLEDICALLKTNYEIYTVNI